MLRVSLLAVAAAVRTRDLVPGPVDVRLLAGDHEWVSALRWTCSHDQRGAGEGQLGDDRGLTTLQLKIMG